MSTGNFENWAGEISEIGAIYPFVGAEWLFAIAGVVFWIWWHFKQTKIENQQFDDDVEKYGNKETLSKIVSKEDPENP